MSETAWFKVNPGELEIDRLTTVVAAGRAICITRTASGYGALDNRCPHQGGPLGDGQLEDGYLICPWHAYEYDPAPACRRQGFPDAATGYAVEQRRRRPVRRAAGAATSRVSLMDQMVDVLCDWGLDTVFGMVGHSNLGLADALRKAEDDGRLRYVGIRHEGAAAFAASGYAKLTGQPAACFSIAGPGATNLLTGLWDAKVDRVPILALTGQVQTQVVGPGSVPGGAARRQRSTPVAEWSQTVLSPENATELGGARHEARHREPRRRPPDLPRRGAGAARPRRAADRAPRRVASPPPEIAPPQAELDRAIELLAARRAAGDHRRQRRPAVPRRGARRCAEHIDAPMITTFKAKGARARRPPARRAACSAAPASRSARPTMARSDCLLVLGASFSNHTGDRHLRADHPGRPRPDDARQVPPRRRAAVGRHRPHARRARTTGCRRPTDPSSGPSIAPHWARWREEKARRAALVDGAGRAAPRRRVRGAQRGRSRRRRDRRRRRQQRLRFGHFFECQARPGRAHVGLPRLDRVRASRRRWEPGPRPAASPQGRRRSPATAASASTSPSSRPR